MTRQLLLLLTSATLAACSGSAASPSDITIPPSTTSTPTHVVLPPLAGGAMPKLQSGTIMLTGETGTGTASFTATPRWDESRTDPTAGPSFGSGAFSLTLGTSSYAASAPQSIFDVLSDDTSTTQYLVLGLLDQSGTSNRAQMIYAIVKQSDFAPGADVALDGVDRYALYVAGALDQDRPDTLAVASIGTIHFGAASALDGTIDATLSASFATADVSALDPTDPADPSSPDGGVTVPAPTAGSYAMHFTASGDVECDGALAGMEADFSALPLPSYGFVDQTVQITVATGEVELSGSQLASGFGDNSLALQASSDGPGGWVAVANPTNALAGPHGTAREASFLTIDTVASATAPYAGYAGVYFVLPDRSGSCSIAADVSYTP